MNEQEKRNYTIVWQSTMKSAVDLIPEEKKGTEEGFKLYEKYHSAIMAKFNNFNKKLNEL